MVRAAVLKMKDPVQIFEELEKIDEMGIVKDPAIYNKRFEDRKRIIYRFFLLIISNVFFQNTMYCNRHR